MDYRPEYTPEEKEIPASIDRKLLKKIADLINGAKRPVLYVGGGVCASNAEKELNQFMELAELPVGYTLMAAGVVGADNPKCLGMLGMHGTIAANKAIDRCDVLLALGTRFSDRVALNPAKFAKRAVRIQVDIDKSEINKNVLVDFSVISDIKEFLQQLLPLIQEKHRGEWMEEILEMKKYSGDSKTSDAMDCAKACGARIARPAKTVSQLKGLFKVMHRLPPFFAVPTTAGTGSETTVAAVIMDGRTHHKYAINDISLVPGWAVLDPVLTVGLPPFITATTGMDVLTHAVEAYIGRSNTAKTKKWAIEATRLVFENLEECHRNGANLVARDNMQYQINDDTAENLNRIRQNVEILMLAQGKLLSDSQDLTEDVIPAPYSLEQTWALGAAAFREAMTQMEQGQIQVRGVAEMLDAVELDITEDKLREDLIAQGQSKGLLYQAPPCRFCDFGGICGKIGGAPQTQDNTGGGQ